nr:glycosidase [Fodinibius sp.]
LRATGEGHISSITFRSGIINSEGNISLDDPISFVSTPEIKQHHSDYEAIFKPDQSLSERILFPSADIECNGIEDARFVEFRNENDNITYYATYTAYDGKRIYLRLLETTDFLHFRMDTIQGPAAQNKGFALFPRKIDGHYAMLSRQDDENNYLMFSDQLLFWDSKQSILEPQFPWEFVKLGNCGSPIETEAGWLVLSHAIGPMRKYVISAFLLDLHDPLHVIGRLQEPLISPNENEREGYVPNVVYSCGSQIYGRNLIIPFAMSDYISSFAIVDLDELLNELTSHKNKI